MVMDVGSMSGTDARKFARIIPGANVVAFEGNPDNYQAMCADAELQKRGVRVLHRLVSNREGERQFFLQRPTQISADTRINKGTSSLMRRNEPGMKIEEICVDAVRIDAFMAREYSDKQCAAMWVDVEGHAYEVLEGIDEVRGRVCVMHVEVETREIWPGQKIEPDILALAEGMGFICIARGKHNEQRDIILVKESWYNANRAKISILLFVSKWVGPLFSRGLMASAGLTASI